MEAMRFIFHAVHSFAYILSTSFVRRIFTYGIRTELDEHAPVHGLDTPLLTIGRFYIVQVF